MTASIGRRLRVFREATGHTQAHIADRLKVARSTVTNWENGYRDPSFEFVEQYCHAIGMQVHIGPRVSAHTDTSSKEA